MLPGWEPHTWALSPSLAHHPEPCPALSARSTVVPGGGRGWMFKFPATGVVWEPGGHMTDALQPLLVRQRPSAAVTRDLARKLLEAGTGPRPEAGSSWPPRPHRHSSRKERRAQSRCSRLVSPGPLPGRADLSSCGSHSGELTIGATSTGRHSLRSTLPVLGCVVLFLGQKGMLEQWVVLALPSASLLVLLPALGPPFWTAPHGHGLSCPCLHLT